jgi:hypothetical protein
LASAAKSGRRHLGQRISTKVFRALADIAHTIIVTSASFKGQDPARVREEVKGIVGDIPVLLAFEPQQALRTARSLQRAGDMIILTGSTYMIEQALNPDPYLRSHERSLRLAHGRDAHRHRHAPARPAQSAARATLTPVPPGSSPA